MFGLFGTEARRLPGASQPPWKQVVIWTLGVLLTTGAMVGFIALFALTNDLFSSKSAPTVQPEQQTQIGPVVENSPAQNTELENVASATNPVTWPLVQVEWSEPRFFKQEPPNTIHTENGSAGVRDLFAMAVKFLPELEELSTERGVGIWVNVTQDKQGGHPEVMLVGINVIDARQAFKAMDQGETPTKGTTILWAKLFVSVDNGTTGYEILLNKTEVDIPALGVSKSDGVVHVFVRENTVQEMWRDAFLPIRDLP